MKIQIAKITRPSSHETAVCYRMPRGGAGVKINDKPLLPLGLHSAELEWGYPGSGPAELALTLCTRWFGIRSAQYIHQDVKRRFVEPLPREGGQINEDEVREWVIAQMVADELE